jgi:hypothetical protein
LSAVATQKEETAFQFRAWLDETHSSKSFMYLTRTPPGVTGTAP